ncbi:MAG: SIS domain-containing protein [Betaproteobacteria bacterium]|nr:SIS domain-containing protein [Betaproteobacteria bacterium]
MTMEAIKRDLLASAQLVQSIAESDLILSRVDSVAQACVRCLREGGKLLFAGNGGSAGDSQHMAGEFVSRFNYDRPGMAAIALTVDSSILTAIGNDYGYDYVFARQVEALGQRGDIFFAYSTSGNSPNILRALSVCRERGLFAVGLTGNRGGSMNGLCDVLFEMPSAQTPRIQEGHLIIGHAICAQVEALMYPRH